MKARFFTAPYVSHDNDKASWQKVFVLMEDGILYCEYLEYMKPEIIREQFNFDTFKETDYSYGREYGKYQHLKEVTYLEAKNFTLLKQSNWVDDYLKRKKLI